VLWPVESNQSLFFFQYVSYLVNISYMITFFFYIYTVVQLDFFDVGYKFFYFFFSSFPYFACDVHSVSFLFRSLYSSIRIYRSVVCQKVSFVWHSGGGMWLMICAWVALEFPVGNRLITTWSLCAISLVSFLLVFCCLRFLIPESVFSHFLCCCSSCYWVIQFAKSCGCSLRNPYVARDPE
jgi:hypothetical protein